MDVFKTAGAVSWTELSTPDPEPSKSFYGKLFGWRFDTMDMGSGPYHVIKLGADEIIVKPQCRVALSRTRRASTRRDAPRLIGISDASMASWRCRRSRGVCPLLVSLTS